MLPILIASALVVLMVGFVGLLLVVNNNRRVSHRAEVAELHQQQARAVIDAQREATRQTLIDLGRELHDNVGQVLAVAKLGLDTRLLAVDDPELAASRDALMEGIKEVRRLGYDLNTDIWQRRDLVDAIRAEAERVQRVLRVKVELEIGHDLPKPPADTTVILYRIFQVILANALNHSRAPVIRIKVWSGEKQGISFSVADNGIGFDPATTPGNAGLVNIHQRCALIGYTANCTTAPGAGCTWHILAPHDQTT
ncbi:MAG: sensor histidine kinase [Flavobacteriales bacterium]